MVETWAESKTAWTHALERVGQNKGKTPKKWDKSKRGNATHTLERAGWNKRQDTKKK
jgi:hypothetical protein